MGLKADTLKELEALMREMRIAPTTIGRRVVNDPTLVTRLRDPKKDVSASTLDRVNRFILEARGQLELDLD